MAAWNLSVVRLWMVTDVFTVCEWVTERVSCAQYTRGAECYELL